MAYNFKYLKDSTFLKKFDKLKLKEQFVKIIVLNFNDERPVQQIQGKVVSGSLTLDSSSSMRRTGNINLTVDEKEANLTNAKNLISINKKVEILIGFTNNTGEYQQYSHIWFPQGVYVIINANISQSSNGLNIALTLHDKMALLNGECGGTLPASIILNEVEDIDEEGNTIIRQPTIFQIIQELVNHFGGEQLGKIIISDLDNRAKKIMKWVGSEPIYLISDEDAEQHPYYSLQVELPQQGDNSKTINPGDDLGYILVDLVYPNDLISKAGDTIVSILDQIKNVVGNYEYFYDTNGNFIFQEIKNYLNRSYTQEIKDYFKENNENENIINEKNINYVTDYVRGKSVYTFENSDIITSISNAPQYQLVKNDFVVWGKRKTLNGNQIPIRYHLAIDKKPSIGNEHSNIISYIDPDDNIKKYKKLIDVDNFNNLPWPPNSFNFYRIQEDNNHPVYQWNKQGGWTVISINELSIRSTDFRSELYLQGLDSQPLALASNYYYTELANEWPKLYDLQHERFFQNVQDYPNQIDFFLDFIDSDEAIAQFGIEKIGRRTLVINDDSINCIFPPDIPEIIIIELGQPNTEDLRIECQKKNETYIQVPSDVYNMLYEGGGSKSAYQEIKKELYQYTSYNEQITLTILPIYYLEPNTRITVNNPVLNIHGDYMIKSITLPLGISETMNISCTKALERL